MGLLMQKKGFFSVPHTKTIYLIVLTADDRSY